MDVHCSFLLLILSIEKKYMKCDVEVSPTATVYKLDILFYDTKNAIREKGVREVQCVEGG
jgi:hypothetical protein